MVYAIAIKKMKKKPKQVGYVCIETRFSPVRASDETHCRAKP